VKPANTELVAAAWVRSLVGRDFGIGTSLPTDNASWATSGFMAVGPIIGGSPNAYVPQRTPVVQLDAYAVTINSDNPNWGKASDIANFVYNACYEMTNFQVALTLRSGYQQAKVQSARPMIEPRRIYDDPGSYAHYQLDIALQWIAI
jgi:hypothetical protein